MTVNLPNLNRLLLFF